MMRPDRLVTSASGVRPGEQVVEALTEEGLCTWLGRASVGDKIAYHNGFLPFDTDPAIGSLGDRRCGELRRLAQRAMLLSSEGLVDLVQRRNGEFDFTYILVARRRRPSQTGRIGVR